MLFGKSFEIAISQSEKLILRFAELSAQSVATPEDLLKGFQALSARGGLEFVGGIEEAARLTKVLVDNTIALTGGINKERQIRTEIDALLAGEVRAGSVLAKQIQARVGNLKEWLA